MTTEPPDHHRDEYEYLHHPDADAHHLKALGFESDFKRDMSPWANFSLGFTYLSPVVGIYSLFAISLVAGGPPMIWSLLIVGVGQLLVALIFSEVVAQYPVAGGVYPWARRLWGRRYAWMTGWVYFVALLATIASVSYGAGPYLATLFGFESTANTTILAALGDPHPGHLHQLHGHQVAGAVRHLRLQRRARRRAGRRRSGCC